MSTPYHTKALPLGSTLREWRLEEILGAGGFGIVYRGRGAYFDETVAIKEYFPTAISDRVDGETVKPTDSSSEEIYALGLQKFVDEAKILWALSKPERHPNIVSVRALFEIHGTAYMVMDFESGVSLSQMLRDGRKFDEASLMALLRPIALGLERAHKGGVVHRDIKPANILVDPDGRPVLIDFGSARFDAGQATSTKVTFYTPPFAALEQYVKTYPQGPWTDIYALGVVAYQCITGAKPAEVLERLHGGVDEALATKDWPGFSRDFTRAVDAAMGIRPSERPQSISDWLKLFEPGAFADPEPDDMTQITVRSSPVVEAAPPIAQPPPAAAKPSPAPAPSPETPDPEAKAKRAPVGLILAGAAVLAVGGGAFAILANGPHAKAPSAPAPTITVVTVAPTAPAPLDQSAQSLLAAARQAALPGPALSAMSAQADQITTLSGQLHALGAPAHGSPQAKALSDAIEAAALKMARAEAAALAASAQTLTGQAERTLGAPGATQTPDVQTDLQTLLKAKEALATAAGAAAKAGDGAGALAAATDALGPYQAFAAAFKAAATQFVPAKQAQLATVASGAHAASAAAVSLAAKPKPWLLAPKAQKAAYQTLQDDAAQAKAQDADLSALVQGAASASDVKTLDADITRAKTIAAKINDLYGAASAAAAVK